MFESLSNNFSKLFDRLKQRGVITEDDLNEAMREVRVALLEADVALPVVKEFVKKIKERALGEEVVRSVSPAQMVVKIVQDELTDILGSEDSALNLATTPPAIIMMMGLQGSGKTTSTAKLALHLHKTQQKKVLMASLDVYRPAAQKQLAVLADQIEGHAVPIIEGEKPLAITKRALTIAKQEGFDIVLLDTAGRLHIDDELMQELEQVKAQSNPIEQLLVVDALTGQDAVNIAKEFHDKVGVSGIVLTRMDGDSRGGAALSMRHITGSPIKFLGVGEKISDFEGFHADRVASRILDMGDVVSLVEKAASEIDEAEAQKMEKRLRKGKFDLNDLASQLRNMRRMGGMGGLLGMLPGIGKLKGQLDAAGVDESILIRQEAIISSMTKQERQHVKLLNASRKRRIAAGSGVEVQDVNRLLKQYKQMQTVFKKMGKMDEKSLKRSGIEQLLKG